MENEIVPRTIRRGIYVSTNCRLGVYDRPRGKQARYTLRRQEEARRNTHNPNETPATQSAAHISDTFGASTTSYSDADGDAVSVRATGWGESLRTTVSFVRRPKPEFR